MQATDPHGESYGARIGGGAVLDEGAKGRDQTHLIDRASSAVQESLGTYKVGETASPADRHVETVTREEELGTSVAYLPRSTWSS